jgi:hypothetical protein
VVWNGICFREKYMRNVTGIEVFVLHLDIYSV